MKYDKLSGFESNKAFQSHENQVVRGDRIFGSHSALSLDDPGS